MQQGDQAGQVGVRVGAPAAAGEVLADGFLLARLQRGQRVRAE